MCVCVLVFVLSSLNHYYITLVLQNCQSEKLISWEPYRETIKFFDTLETKVIKCKFRGQAQQVSPTFCLKKRRQFDDNAFNTNVVFLGTNKHCVRTSTVFPLSDFIVISVHNYSYIHNNTMIK